MKEIQLTKGFTTMVNDDDFDFLSQWKWRALIHHTGNIYAVRTDGNKWVRMHRVIMSVSDRSIIVDHKDRNSLNNQRHNLRLCNTIQSSSNRRPNIKSSSKYRGVSYVRATNKWRAQIEHKNKTYILGSFTSEVDAALAYNKKAIDIHGEFAYINIITCQNM